jgi:hypothetical protein
MIKQNNIKFYIILLLFILNYYFFDNISLNENLSELEIIIKLIERYLDPQNIPVLNEQEKIIAEYWKIVIKCPFSKLTSHGLSKEEALLLIDFFEITDIEDLKKLEEFIKKK